MAKSGKLTVRAAATTKPGDHGDGGGLYLVVAKSGSGRWIYRFTIQGKTSEAGLGSREAGVSLAEARDKAAAARKLVKSGVNPIEEKRQAKKALIAKPSFGAIADALIAAKESEWRNERHRQQWRVTLQTYAAPLYPRPVDEIDTAAVLGVLAPLWGTKFGNSLAPARPHRDGSRRGQGAGPSRRRKPGGVARSFGACAAQARQARAGSSCRDALCGRARLSSPSCARPTASARWRWNS